MKYRAARSQLTPLGRKYDNGISTPYYMLTALPSILDSIFPLLPYLEERPSGTPSRDRLCLVDRLWQATHIEETSDRRNGFCSRCLTSFSWLISPFLTCYYTRYCKNDLKFLLRVHSDNVYSLLADHCGLIKPA